MIVTLNAETIREIIAEAISRRLGIATDADAVELDKATYPHSEIYADVTLTEPASPGNPLALAS